MHAHHLLSACMGWLVIFSGTLFSASSPTPEQMAAKIDEHLRRSWKTEGVTPAPRSTDAEFLRRAYLDLTGIIPPVNGDRPGDENFGVRGFLKDARPDKRRRLIDYLLQEPRHATHLAAVWKNALLPPDADVRRFGGDAGFQTWLRDQFADERSYDEMVRELMVATGAGNQTGPALFYTTLELQPENVAAATSRMFLGTQIQCAQCHDHPFDHWTRKDFWGYAAFFARLRRPANAQQRLNQVNEIDTGEVTIPDTDEVVPPRFLGGELSPDLDKKRRERLAEWMTESNNPYFARATVNRVWALLFGRGIVEPVDDLGAHNPPSHPELLNELAEYFVQTDYDIKKLIQAMTYSQAYQLASASVPGESVRPELFSRMAIKSLTAEQLYDCLAEGMRRRHGDQAAVSFFDQGRQEFLARFRAPTQGATQYESGIPQALTLMNGTRVREATDVANGDLLGAINIPIFSIEKRVEILFLSTLSRMPKPAERKEFVAYVTQGGAAGDQDQAMSDVLWALLNSAEFALNH